MFITFEGIEGSGKSTQFRRLADRLPQALATREPGGTAIGDRVRALLLDSKSTMDPIAEVFLFAASRRQLVTEVIRPALESGRIVLCDRYADSTLAYQAFGRLITFDRLRALTDWATDSVRPDVTVLLDLPEEVGLQRARSRNAMDVNDEGRFEAEDIRFHRRVREGYLTLAGAEPGRFAVINADGTPDEVFDRMMKVIAPKVGL